MYISLLIKPKHVNISTLYHWIILLSSFLLLPIRKINVYMKTKWEVLYILIRQNENKSSIFTKRSNFIRFIILLHPTTYFGTQSFSCYRSSDVVYSISPDMIQYYFASNSTNFIFFCVFE